MNFNKEGHLYFSKADDYITTPLFGKNDITQEIFQMALYSGVGEDNLLGDDDDCKPLYKYNKTASNSTIYVWAHGNRSKNWIGSSTQKVSPADLLVFFQKLGLRKDHAGDICIWSCWAGAEDGFARAFALECKKKGYLALSVWGSKHITGSLVKGFPMTDEVGEKRKTKESDFSVYRPADMK